LILSAAMLLDWQGQRYGNAKLVAAAALVESAVDQVLENPFTRTRDIGGSLDTDAFTEAVIGALGQK
jgi:isocitrate/isopropylmalate dehydrogenase